MADSPREWPDFVLVGANHRSASAVLRESLLIDDADLGEVFQRLRAAGLGQALVLSTCDRVEVHTVAADADSVSAAVSRLLGERAGIDAAELATSLYTLEGEAAARHLFAIAASLDSLVIGEPHVLGQVKASHRAAQAAGMIGADLDGLLQAAYGAAKRVRSETTIGERPVSIAAAAVQVARDIHGDLAPRTGLLIGLGEMGELVAEKLVNAGLGSLAVTHRSIARCAGTARRLGANVVSYDGLADALAAADIVICAVGLGSFVVTPASIRDALDRRRQRAMFVVDLAVPRDADPAIDAIDGAFRYDSGDLEAVALAGLSGREAVAEDAWRLVEEGLAKYRHGLARRAAATAPGGLRDHLEALRRDVLTDTDGADAETATRRLIDRLLDQPGGLIEPPDKDANDDNDDNEETPA